MTQAPDKLKPPKVEKLFAAIEEGCTLVSPAGSRLQLRGGRWLLNGQDFGCYGARFYPEHFDLETSAGELRLRVGADWKALDFDAEDFAPELVKEETTFIVGAFKFSIGVASRRGGSWEPYLEVSSWSLGGVEVQLDEQAGAIGQELRVAVKRARRRNEKRALHVKGVKATKAT